jgi:hypothetical protein
MSTKGDSVDRVEVSSFIRPTGGKVTTNQQCSINTTMDPEAIQRDRDRSAVHLSRFPREHQAFFFGYDQVL